MTPAVLVGPTASFAALRIRPAEPSSDAPETAPPSGGGGQVSNTASGYADTLVQAGSIGALTINDRPEHAPDPTPWLRAVWSLGFPRQARVELRFLRCPGSQGIRAYLLVRAPEPAAAADMISQLRQYLPGNLLGVPVTDLASLHGVLAPFQPDPSGIAEIGKCVTAQRTTRADATTPWLAVVTPWRRHDGTSWSRVWAELAAQPASALVSVGLLPFRVGDNLKLNLQARAAEMAYLAQPGPSPTGAVFGAGRAPDQFALAAAPVLAEAVSRYVDEAFQIRVSIAAARPLPPHFVHQLAQAVSPGHPTAGLSGRPATVLRPSGPESLTAWRNITDLRFDPLPSSRALPLGALSPLDQTLTAIATPDEAAAACQLPHHATLPLLNADM
ncbi:hypothetical protein [Kutzneria sp. NPDC052558]|uniref:hypothetical protein n=1 Tax=Kutzneria sp. NPDC052558 TaxID=3364121 RepID=UPI0037CC3F5D